ncbi:MAG: adenylyltransferase/cytidyltransferase family protein [Candidatus Eremiobacteraeota bacterium]|nr:adenylyltransferase/cytidyltransferase family protein [Candidatus Eremiobacteraeota bacterium]MBV8497894.1 adenylyltransferase/cytidyltransferase family protein [Candidatus Eremiobacteraeota bacterium]
MSEDRLFGRLLAVGDAVGWREKLRAEHRCVVFTNGCFDVLHAGHVEYLAWARAQGDALIVGLNEDESVTRIKGRSRPIVAFSERARVLLALRSVDVVVGFAERTPEVLLDRIRPDVHVKSDQYREEELPERSVVLGHGGRIALAPHVAGESTTDTIARILHAYSVHR